MSWRCRSSKAIRRQSTTPNASGPPAARSSRSIPARGCHLDAVMLAKGLQQLDPPVNSVVLIENVGNLVCPALFDLGERSRVVIASVTEGDDKPIKYPHMFRQSDLMILNKIDLLPYVPFSVDRCLAFARQVNPRIRIIQVSALRGDGLEEWYDWIRQQTRSHARVASECFNPDMRDCFVSVAVITAGLVREHLGDFGGRPVPYGPAFRP